MSVWSAACRLLAKHLQSGKRLDFLLESLSNQLSPVDRRRCRRLLYGAIRHLSLLESAVNQHLKSRPRPILRASLLLGAFELLEDAESAPAVIHHAVDRARELASANEARLVNAVLRKVQNSLKSVLEAENASTVALALRFSHPEWLVERWLGQFGYEATRQLLEWDQQPAPLYARVSNPETERDLDMPAFFLPTAHPGLFRLEHPDWEQVEALLAIGHIYLQNPATALAPDLLGVSAGETVLDVCAAPGGKSLQLAERVGSSGRVVALDLPGQRLDRLHENLAKHAEAAVSAFGFDATRIQPENLQKAGLPDSFDAVLVDVACSNTGVLRHRVDAKWRLRPVDLKKLPRLQQNILRNVAHLVRPGGRLVYSTCSLESEENQGVVDSFLEQSAATFTIEGSTISHPWETGFDGAAAFLLRRAL